MTAYIDCGVYCIQAQKMKKSNFELVFTSALYSKMYFIAFAAL